MRANKLRGILDAGRPAIGGWCTIPSSVSAEIVASLGFEYICVDMQHGLMDFGGAVAMLQAISGYETTPIVRVPVGNYGVAQRVLDAGAEGVIFPMTNTAAETREAVAACRYAPAGKRSMGPVRSYLHLGEDTHNADAQVMCMVMIETVEALANLDEILSVPGLNGLDHHHAHDLGVGVVRVLSEVQVGTNRPHAAFAGRRIVTGRHRFARLGGRIGHREDHAFRACIQDPLGDAVIPDRDPYDRRGFVPGYGLEHRDRAAEVHEPVLHVDADVLEPKAGHYLGRHRAGDCAPTPDGRSPRVEDPPKLVCPHRCLACSVRRSRCSRSVGRRAASGDQRFGTIPSVFDRVNRRTSGPDRPDR